MNRQVISAVAAAMLMAGTAQAQQSTRWVYESSKDPFTDEIRHYAYTATNMPGFLFVGCANSSRMYVLVKLGHLDMRIDSLRNVTWRVDDNEPILQMWRNNKKGGAMIYDQAAYELAQKIEDATQRVVVQSNGNTEQFSVKGSTAAIGKVLDNCRG